MLPFGRAAELSCATVFTAGFGRLCRLTVETWMPLAVVSSTLARLPTGDQLLRD